MRLFGEALREMKLSLFKVILFEEALNSILLFLVVYLVASLFNFGFFLPLLASFLYLAFAFYREHKVRADKLVESKYKSLKEKLSTAMEYSNVDSRVANELKSEVLQNLKKVEESSFLSGRRTYVKAFVAVALCFIILIMSPFSFDIKKALPFSGGDEDEEEQPAIYAGNFKVSGKPKNDAFVVAKGSKNIYGSPSVAKLGDEELKVVLKPAGMELGTNNVRPAEELDFVEHYPEEVVSVAAESMEERIPKEQQELVRRYFKNVVEADR